MANIKSINGNPIVLGNVGLEDGAVQTRNIANNAVIGDKINDLAVRTEKLANNAVTTEKIAPNTITYADISVTGVDRIHQDNINDEAINTRVLADGAVTAVKLSNEVQQEIDTVEYLETNLLAAMEPTYNINDSPIGRWYYSTSDGVRYADIAGTHVGMRDLVAVDAQTSYRLKAFQIGGTIYWNFYDSNKGFLSGSHAGSGTKNAVVTTPEGCAYISAFMYAGGGLTLYDDAAILITADTTKTELVQHLSAVDLVARDGIDEVERVLAEGAESTRNINTAEVGRWYIRATGAIEASSGNYIGMAEKVAAQPSTTYTVTLYNASFSGNCDFHVAEYDENEAFIQKAVYNAKTFATFTTLAETHYVCVHAYKSSGITIGDDSHIQIEVGSQSTAYVPPYTFIDYVAREGAEGGIPSYFVQNVQDAVEKVNSDLLPVGKHGDAFVFITDVHWRNNTQHSPTLVRYVLENTNVKMVINGGDNLQSHLTTKDGAAKEIMEATNAFVFDGVKCLGVMGNHDNNRNNNSDHPEAYLSQDEQFSVINRTYGSDGLHYGNGNYYYYDNDVAKIRYMMLDWGASSAEQTAWVASVMGALPDGYKAVVVVHGIYRTTSGDETHELIMERQYILDAFEPYKEDVLFFIQGHTHWDGVVDAYANGTPIVITSCDTYSEAAGSVRNTVDEQCFDIVVFDYTAGTVKCTRVGRGTDRTVEL